jgi:PAS domain S-box-containing protein
MVQRDPRGGGKWDRAGTQVEALKAVIPSLADLPPLTADSAALILRRVAETTEGLRRRVIRDGILRSSLEELMQALLQSGDPERILGTLASYLRQVLGAGEVLLLRRNGEPGRWNGYLARTDGEPQRLDGVAWVPEEPAAGEGGSTPAVKAGARGDRDAIDPARFSVVVPLFAEGAQDRPGAGETLGYLCLDRRAAGEEEWNPQEVARRVGAMLATLEHREEMERAHRFRRQLLEAMQDGVIALDAEGSILEANAASGRYLGPAGSDLRGRSIDELDEPASVLVRHLRSALVEKKAPEPRELALPAGERRVPVNVAVSELREGPGRFAGVVVNLTDLSTVRRMEQEIDRLDRLAAIGRFAAGIAHEVRNPLAGIGAGVEYLARRFGPDAPEQEDVRFVSGEVARLNRIVSDLLDYAHPRPLELGEVPVAALAEAVRSSVRPMVEGNGLILELSGPPDASILADRERVEQVLLNLVKNAIEASSRDGRIRLRWEPCGAGSERVRIRVEDEGTGMGEDARRRAFEPFFTTKGSGTGLGLYLSHSIIRQHGGRLMIANRRDRGTSVSIELPAAAGEGQQDHDVVHLDR